MRAREQNTKYSLTTSFETSHTQIVAAAYSKYVYLHRTGGHISALPLPMRISPPTECPSPQSWAARPMMMQILDIVQGQVAEYVVHGRRTESLGRLFVPWWSSQSAGVGPPGRIRLLSTRSAAAVQVTVLRRPGVNGNSRASLCGSAIRGFSIDRCVRYDMYTEYSARDTRSNGVKQLVGVAAPVRPRSLNPVRWAGSRRIFRGTVPRQDWRYQTNPEEHSRSGDWTGS